MPSSTPEGVSCAAPAFPRPKGDRGLPAYSPAAPYSKRLSSAFSSFPLSFSKRPSLTNARMCAIASSRSAARSFASFTSAMLTTLRTLARSTASSRGRPVLDQTFCAFSFRSSRIISRNSSKSSAPDRSTSCFVNLERTSSSVVSRSGSFWNARTISSNSNPPLPSVSNRENVTSHNSSNSFSETSMMRLVVCSSRNCRIIVSNSSMSKPPELSTSNSLNFALT
mmetsp:Transcript_9602/g.40224  ORF Transcript_9602/g.40224 Transcript_9602/m.40224 type:complete len:224 (-) Transcript_9602:2423-3094(-)